MVPFLKTKVAITQGAKTHHYKTYLDAEVIEAYLWQEEQLASNNDHGQSNVLLEYTLVNKHKKLVCQTTKVQLGQVVRKMKKYDAFVQKKFGHVLKNKHQKEGHAKQNTKANKIHKVKSHKTQILEKIDELVKSANQTGSTKCPFMMEFKEYDIGWKEEDVDVALNIYEMQNNGINVGKYHFEALAMNPGRWTHFSWDGIHVMPDMKSFYMKMYGEYKKNNLQSFQGDL